MPTRAEFETALRNADAAGDTAAATAIVQEMKKLSPEPVDNPEGLTYGGRGGSALKPKYDFNKGPQPKVPMGAELNDLWKSVAIGVPEVATDLAGIPRFIQDLPGAIVRRAAHPFDEKARDKMYEGEQAFEKKLRDSEKAWLGFSPRAALEPPTSEDVKSTIEKVTGPWYEPKYLPGRFGNNITRQIGGALVPIGKAKAFEGLIPKAASGAGAGAVSQGLNESSDFGQGPIAQFGGSLIGALLGHRLGTAPGRYSPKTIAAQTMTQTVKDAGTTPAEVAARMREAQGAGAGGFDLADALGPRGQNLRAQAVEAANPQIQDAAQTASETKIAGGPGRVQGVLETLAGGQQSANALRARALAARSAEADIAFGDLRAKAAPANTAPVVDYLSKTINPQKGAKLSSIDQELQTIKDKLVVMKEQNIGGKKVKVPAYTDDWSKVEAVRLDIKDSIDTAYAQSDKARVRALSRVRDELDKSLESASPGYTKAMTEFKDRSAVLNQYEQGKKMSGGNVNTKDVTAYVMGLTPDQKAAFRAGYMEKPIVAAQKWQPGSNPPSAVADPRLAETLGVVAGGGDTALTAALDRERGLNRGGKTLATSIERSRNPDVMSQTAKKVLSYLSGALPGVSMAAPIYYAAQHAGDNPGAFAALVGAPMASAALKGISRTSKAKSLPKILEALTNSDPGSVEKALNDLARRGYKIPKGETAARTGLLGILAGAR